MLVRSPVIAMCCTIALLIYGTMNIVFSTLGLVFQQRYRFSTGQSGLIYIGMALGSVTGAFVSGQTNDKLVAVLTKRYGGETYPEYRIPPILLGAILISTGLLEYGWTSQNNVYWIAPVIGLALLGFGLTTVHVRKALIAILAYNVLMPLACFANIPG